MKCAKCRKEMRLPGRRYHPTCDPEARNFRQRCPECKEWVRELPVSGRCFWCENTPVRVVIAGRQQIVKETALQQCRRHRGEVRRPCRQCRNFGIQIARQADRDLVIFSGQIIVEVGRYIGAVEAMSVPRSGRVWDAQEELVGHARALKRAAGSVRELIHRSRETKNE